MKMYYFMIFSLFPTIFAAEIRQVLCKNGTQCPEGNYCCELPNGESGCCETSNELRTQTDVYPASPSYASDNEPLSVGHPKTMRAYCPGTQCGNYCIPNIYGGKCCRSTGKACPSGTRCCYAYYSDSRPWCCKSYQSCSTSRGMCLSSIIDNNNNKGRIGGSGGTYVFSPGIAVAIGVGILLFAGIIVIIIKKYAV